MLEPNMGFAVTTESYKTENMAITWPPNLGFNVRKLPILANLGEGGFPLRK